MAFALGSGTTVNFVKDPWTFTKLKALSNPKEIFVAKAEQSILVRNIGQIDGLNNTVRNVVIV